jgi:hypothetical protein
VISLQRASLQRLHYIIILLRKNIFWKITLICHSPNTCLVTNCLFLICCWPPMLTPKTNNVVTLLLAKGRKDLHNYRALSFNYSQCLTWFMKHFL